MDRMSAIVADGDGFRLGQQPRPQRMEASDIVVEVARVSVNRGEFGFAWDSGAPAGWDAYGVVLETSEDGAGPSVGSRVSTWAFSGAWAQYRVLDRVNVAIVPSGVRDETAAALPVAGLTALRAVRQLGLAAGSSVAVTGATGGVGHLAVQLGVAAELNVTAVVRGDEGSKWLRANIIHPDELILSVAELPRTPIFDAVIDTVGGSVLSAVVQAVRPGGIVLLVGGASGSTTTLNTADLVTRRIDLITYKDYSAAGKDLGFLLGKIERNELSLHVSDGGRWERIVDEPVDRLLSQGKTTLSVS